MAKKTANVKIMFRNLKSDLNNHENNNSKPYYVVSTCPRF